MFCSTCGKGVVHGLAYCNHCGEKLLSGQNDLMKTSGASADSLVWAIVSVFVVGMGTIIGLMAVMKTKLLFDIGPILFFSILSFALMTLIETVFIWMLLSRNRRGAVMIEKRDDKHATKELGAAPQRVLAEPFASVTEEATRAFEPIYEKRK